jgi:shikimate kinase
MVFLIGFMGSGKTTVGAALARRLGTRFIDLDALIELAAGCSIAEIFDHQGEPAFRELEHLELRNLLAKPRNKAYVVALGGGAFAQPRNLELIEQAGAAVAWLDAPPEVLLERCRQHPPARPLARDPDAFLRLWRERIPFYERARLRVDATLPVADVIEQILAQLKESQRR